MPSRDQIVETEFLPRPAYPPAEEFNDVIVFDRALDPDTAGGGNEAPTIGFNDPKNYDSAEDVAADFGEQSDAAVAARKLDPLGADDYDVIVVRETEETETLTPDANGVATATTGDSFAGNFEVQVSVGGTAAGTSTPVTASPPDADRDPGDDEALVNYDTKEVVPPAGSTAGSDVEVTFHALHWSEAFRQLNSLQLDIATLANVKGTRAHIGDYDILTEWGTGAYVRISAGYANGNTYESNEAAMQAAWDITSYVQAGSFVPVANKSPDDVGSAQAGLMAARKPWQDTTNKEIAGLNMPDEYPDNLVGVPGDYGTFEGGQELDGVGRGGTNVLRSLQGVVCLSNNLTSAGSGSKYRYSDAFGLEGYVDRRINTSLAALTINNEIPFTKDGQNQIRTRLNDTLTKDESPTGAYSDLVIDVPPATGPNGVSREDRANKTWGPIRVDYRMNQNAHRFFVQVQASV